MINGYDLAYGLAAAVSAPLWLTVPSARRKVLRAWRQRRGQGIAPRSTAGPAVLIHAVSLGEINATAALVARLRHDRPDLAVIVSVTTDTGYARGCQLYPPDLDGGGAGPVQLVRFPLDLSPAIGRLLDAARPSTVVLMEGELWPNFLRQCQRRSIPVALINGRLTPSSFRNYRLIRPIAAAMLRRLSIFCVQEERYARQFRQLGAPAERVQVTGTMKFDTAAVADRVDGDAALAVAVGLPLLDPQRPVWVCGSTGPGEEAILLRVYQQLLTTYPALRLVIVPRHPQRFDAVADVITTAGFPLTRRSRPGPPPADAVVLGDTMGELRTFYSLATVVFVGRSLLDLGPRQRGSDMIEPAALAKPVAVGRWTQNFAEVVDAFTAANAIAVVADAAELCAILAQWLGNASLAGELGRRSQAVVRSHRGATDRHAAVILSCVQPAVSPVI